MWKADKTLAAIEAALESDKCGQFRQLSQQLLPKMNDAYRGQEKPFRKHLGASMIGGECARQLQLKWRWCVKPQFPERVLRLFNRGHLEEARFLAMLLCVPGVELWYETEDGGQFKWSYHNGHYGSALDGIIRGCPDLPAGVPAYAEFKTSATKGFQITKNKGLRENHFEHYIQMQQCMMAYDLKYALYIMVNKDNDELHAEIIEYNHSVALQYKDRAKTIIFADQPMPRISNKSTFFKCKFCDEKDVCHGKAKPEVNCRTCTYWEADPKGGYICHRSNPEVHTDESMVGCGEYLLADLLKGK